MRLLTEPSAAQLAGVVLNGRSHLELSAQASHCRTRADAVGEVPAGKMLQARQRKAFELLTEAANFCSSRYGRVAPPLKGRAL